MRLFTILILLTICPASVMADDLPAGYRFPAEEDMTDDWRTYKNEISHPYLVEADFDGNGIMDQAWILFENKGTHWGLFVFLGRNNEAPITLKLDVARGVLAQHIGIVGLDPGKYETACGKGYWDCQKGESKILDLKLPGIDFFTYESAHSVFYWNEPTTTFKQIWMSD